MKRVLHVIINIGAVLGMFLMMYICFKADEKVYVEHHNTERHRSVR